MRIKFEIYSSLLKEVTDLSNTISKTMQEFTHNNTEVMIGWKIGTVTVTLPKNTTGRELKNKLEEMFRSKVTDKKLWLKEVAYAKK